MSQFPPAYGGGNQPQGGFGAAGLDPHVPFGGPESLSPERTSMTAIFGAIAGGISVFLCCIPGVGPAIAVVGLALSLAGIFLISSSRGRLSGRGAAIAGIVTSLLGLVFGGIVLAGLLFGFKSLGTYGEVLAGAEAGDLPQATAPLSPAAASAVDSARLADFKARYTAQVGGFREVTPGFWSTLSAYSDAVQRIDVPRLQSVYGANIIPLPITANFANGPAVIVLVTEQAQTQGANPKYPMGLAHNVAVLPPTGEPIWLIDPRLSVPPANPAPVPADPNAAPPAVEPEPPASAPASPG